MPTGHVQKEEKKEEGNKCSHLSIMDPARILYSVEEKFSMGVIYMSQTVTGHTQKTRSKKKPEQEFVETDT